MDKPPYKEMLSIVVPVYNEQEVLTEFYRRLCEVLEQVDMNAEIVVVNDGSDDGTIDLLQDLYDQDDRLAIVDLSRNFGKEIALTAGLHNASGDAVIVIDADLQEPPELIPELLREWRNGYDVVYAKRASRQSDTLVKRATARAFYRLMQYVSRVKIPEDTGDYRLLSKRAVAAVNRFREQHRFMKGLFTWIGYPQKAVVYDRDPRHAGDTKWSYIKLVDLAIEGITSYSTAPLRIATGIGLVTATAAFAYGFYKVLETLLVGNPVDGYPSLLVIMLFLGGAQLTAIGVMGEYLGRIFNETKQRPLYFVQDLRPRRSEGQRPDRQEEIPRVDPPAAAQ